MRRCAGSRGELCAAAGLRIADGAPPLPLDPAWDLAGAAATLARKEELGGAVDEHGRFPASASVLPAGAAPLDELVLALREAAAAAGVEPAPDYPGGARFAVALTHDIDTPWRWSARGLLGAGARLKAALARGDTAAARLEAQPVWRVAPLHLPARQRPQLVARALRCARAASRLLLDVLRARGASRPARRRFA